METRELTKEEFEVLNKDLEDVLKKHNAELSVKSVIQLLKYTDEETAKTDEEASGVR